MTFATGASGPGWSPLMGGTFEKWRRCLFQPGDKLPEGGRGPSSAARQLKPGDDILVVIRGKVLEVPANNDHEIVLQGSYGEHITSHRIYVNQDDVEYYVPEQRFSGRNILGRFVSAASSEPAKKKPRRDT